MRSKPGVCSRRAPGYTDAQFIARMYMYAGDEAEKAAEKLLQRRLSASRWRISPENGSFSGWK